MATNSKMLMIVIVSEADIRRVVLPAKPASVEDLICQVQETLGFNFSFTVQYEDPDFNNSLCNLTDMSELPEKPTLKLFPTLLMMPVDALSEQLSDTPSKADTEILSNSSSLERVGQCVDVEYRCRQGKLAHLKDGALLKITKELKHEILERLAERMYTFRAYPDNAEYDEVAAALVKKHPCLSERGSRNGWSGWQNSLKFKMGNYRTKRRKLGSHDVAVNGGKCGMNLPDGEPPRKNIKKSFDPSLITIKQNMDLSFALRQKEVVEKKPAIYVFWTHFLFFSLCKVYMEFIYMEFTRIVGIDLKQYFYEGFDQHNSRLVEVFRTKRGLTGQILSKFLQKAKTSEPTVLRTLALRGLPVILGGNPEDFKTSFDADEEQTFSSIATGILVVEHDEGGHPPNSLCLNPLSMGIILEGKVVMDNLHNLPQAMCLFFGLTYALHLDYPKCMSYTFEFIQQVILKLGQNKLKPKLQSLLNQLLL
uniref:PB1 domain-containing protein n=1 Tax=Pygocentrus nattereri TaxID=42514 RepID=A0AAR2M274_PYGNA